MKTLALLRTATIITVNPASPTNQLKELHELRDLRQSSSLLLKISAAKIRLDRRSDKYRIAQSFCLYIHDSIESILLLSNTPYVSQGGGIARSGIESCIAGSYLLISSPEIRRRYIAYSAFAVARNVKRYLEAFPNALDRADGSIDELISLGESRREEFGFNERTSSGIERSSADQSKCLDTYSVREGLPAEWRKIHRLGLVPTHAFAHPTADATVMSFEHLNMHGERSMGHERAQYLKGFKLGVRLFQHVMLKELPDTKHLAGLRVGTSCTSTIQNRYLELFSSMRHP